MVVDMGDFLFQLVITHLPGRKKGGWMVLCVGSRLMEQPVLLCLLTLYMFGRIPCSSIDNGCRRVVKDIKLWQLLIMTLMNSQKISSP